MRRLLALAVPLLVLFPAAARAQAPAAGDDKAAVLAAVQTFFETMTSRDAEGARRVLMPDGRFFAVSMPKGEPAIRATAFQDYLANLATRKQVYRERMWDPDVRIHGPIAVVWTRYDFWVDGTFSHCGIDAFDLARTSEGWKISGGIYTVERTGCQPSPLGPLK